MGTMMGTRSLTEDTVLGGYLLPAGTQIMADAFVNGRSPELFEGPLVFRPERWFKGEGGEGVNPYSNVAFGFGARGCIGRKTAETEMQVLLARLLQKFELRYGGEKEVELITRSFLV